MESGKRREILVLDDEILAAEYLAALICEVDEKAEVVTEINPLKSLELAEQQFHVCLLIYKCRD